MGRRKREPMSVGKKTKKIRGKFGETEIEVPHGRDGSFEPQVVK